MSKKKINTPELSFISKKSSPVKQENQSYNDKQPKSRRGRIIVRNLPFKNLSENKLRNWFKKYGDIDEVSLLRKEDGRFVGCGFVQFSSAASAGRAVEEANQTEVEGRQIIVDWAVPKKKYEGHVKNVKNKVKKEVPAEDDDVSHGGTELPYCIDTKPAPDDEPKFKTEADGYGYDRKEDLKQNVRKKSGFNKNGNENKISVKSNDVEEGKTLFVRNIPFSSTNDDLRNVFSKFGVLEYALICVDKLTEHSKGTGFVKFKEKKCAEQCLLQANNIFLDENLLIVSVAVSKENLQNKDDKKRVRDSRNLYLSKEGVIMAGSPAAKGVSATDMAKRLEIEQWKSQILKNLNMFISDRRLIIHNLPPTYDDAQLSSLFKKHGNPKAVITEAKVMRDRKQIDPKSGMGISKEYGFVSFTSHEDALHALRSINNNPKIFTVKTRPIVAFSIESKGALNVKKKRLEKSRLKLGIDDQSKPGKLMQMNRKQRRFIMRRQKLIERRREAKKLKRQSSKEEVSLGRKRKSSESNVDSKSRIFKKMKSNAEATKVDEAPGDYCGIVSKPGTKVKLRSRFKLKTQAKLHKQQLKEEKLQRMKKKQGKVESVKDTKQKKKLKLLHEDGLASKLIKKHTKKVLEGTSTYKKWDES